MLSILFFLFRMSEVNTFGVRLRTATQESYQRDVNEVTKGSVRAYTRAITSQRVYIILQSVTVSYEYRAQCKGSTTRDTPSSSPFKAINKPTSTKNNECKELEVNNQIVESNQE